MWYISIKGILGICLFFLPWHPCINIVRTAWFTVTRNFKYFSVWIGWLSINYLILQLHSRMTHLGIYFNHWQWTTWFGQLTQIHDYTRLVEFLVKLAKLTVEFLKLDVRTKTLKLVDLVGKLLKKFGKWRRLYVGTAGSALQAKRQWETWQ